MGKIIRLFVVLIVIAGAAGAIYAWVGSRSEADAGYTVIEVSRGSITEKALAVGQIEPRERFQVKSKVSGIVARCLVEVGDQVDAGDALFEIAPDPTPQELAPRPDQRTQRLPRPFPPQDAFLLPQVEGHHEQQDADLVPF